jgi:cell division protease FtsH
LFFSIKNVIKRLLDYIIFGEKMKFWSKERILSIFTLCIVGVSLIGGRSLLNNAKNNPDSKQNRASSKMTYGRFLEYVDMGWIKTVDFYENGRIAIIEASSPELGNRAQKIRVEIPVGASPLIVKLREAKVNFTSHPSANFDGILGLLSNIFIPLVILVGLVLLFRRSGNFLGEPGQGMNFRKARVKVQMEANTSVGFSDVAGIDEAKEEFEEVVTFLKNPQPFTSVGAKIPKGVILVGPPGTGKTLLAKAIAGEAGVPFISISGSEFVEMFVGIGASRVRDLFKTAKTNAPCIVFIDEIDAVGRQRGAGVGGGNDEREQTLNQILTEMDGFQGNTGVIVIAATNRVDVLDGALLRPGRFDRQVNVNLPDVKGRLAILKVHGRNKKIDSNVSLEMIAQRTPGFSGADLANLLNEAAILTARRNKSSMTMSEVNTAIDRVIAGLEGSPLTDTKNKRLVAYHEIGHAIIGSLLKYHDNVQKVTLIPRGQARGLTWFTPNEDQALVSRSQLVARIIGSLGGRAAEEVVFGSSEITTGASNDLQQVTSLARQMVTRFGMSTVGPLSLDSGGGQVFLGRGLQNGNEFSSVVADKIDDQVKIIIQHCYDQAIYMIKKNRILMDQLVDKLIQDETIEGDVFLQYVDLYTKLPTKFTSLKKKVVTEETKVFVEMK